MFSPKCKKTLPAKIPKPVDLTSDQIALFGPPTPSSPRSGLKDPESALNLLPIQKLPKCLLPRPRRRTQPPVLRLGYAVTYDWVRVYTEEHGLPCEVPRAIDYINNNCGSKSMTVRLGMIYQLPCMRKSGTYYWLLSICTSYPVPAENPTMDDAIKLQKFLGAPDLPAWYLDRDDLRWGKKSFRCRV